MALNVAHHQAWEQILALANNADFKEGTGPGTVPAGTGLTTLIAMYKTAEGGAQAQAVQTVNRVTSPGKR
jgi:hypothetical protein